MKIIQEIEKSRLSEDNMNELVGGAQTPGDNCNDKVKYTSCQSKFYIAPCATLLSCPVSYYWDCTGPAPSQKRSCPGFWDQY